MATLKPSNPGTNKGEKPNFNPRLTERIEVNVINTIKFQTRNSQSYAFQNFFWRQKMVYDGSTYDYLPFAFSGIAINRSGENVDAELTFPNNNLARGWALQAIEEVWGCEVRVATTGNPEQAIEGFTTMYKYFGLCAAGGWDDKVITVRLNSVLDSVGAEIPTISLDNVRVGPLPTTTSVRL